MYRILTFAGYIWDERHATRYDSVEDALTQVDASLWRIQEWIEPRSGPAEAGFWSDCLIWLNPPYPYRLAKDNSVHHFRDYLAMWDYAEAANDFSYMQKMDPDGVWRPIRDDDPETTSRGHFQRP